MGVGVMLMMLYCCSILNTLDILNFLSYSCKENGVQARGIHY